MPFVRLEHHPKLRARQVDAASAAIDPDGTRTIVSFRRGAAPDRTIVVDATTRLAGFAEVRHLVLDHVEADSDLALPILNDIAHALPVGAVVETLGAVPRPILERGYYAPSFERVDDGTAEGAARFVKRAPCLTEADRGLEAWSFCIPVGPGDATALNHLVERIASFTDLDIEILLGGTPGDTFRHHDRVRIVPDRRAPEEGEEGAINISTKKNILVEHARHPNVCVLHDRVFLPSDFGRIMRRHGEIHAMHTLQSLYFDDYRNLAPIRYSDFMTVYDRSALNGLVGLARDRRTLSRFAPAALPQFFRDSAFKCQHATRSDELCFPTGSLYICKRSLWMRYPQDETLLWSEGEDIEHGLRLGDNGVPSRVNPFGITQSINARALLLNTGELPVITASGKVRRTRLPLAMGAQRRKPYHRRTQPDALEALRAMAHRNGFESYEPPRQPAAMCGRDWMAEVLRVVHGIQVRNDEESILQFIREWLDVVHHDAWNHVVEDYFLRRIRNEGTTGLASFLLEYQGMRWPIVMRPGGSVFRTGPRDYLVRDRLALRLGSMVSALRLWRSRHKHLWLAGGPRDYYRAIMASTPLETER